MYFDKISAKNSEMLEIQSFSKATFRSSIVKKPIQTQTCVDFGICDLARDEHASETVWSKIKVDHDRSEPVMN